MAADRLAAAGDLPPGPGAPLADGVPGDPPVRWMADARVFRIEVLQPSGRGLMGGLAAVAQQFRQAAAAWQALALALLLVRLFPLLHKRACRFSLPTTPTWNTIFQRARDHIGTSCLNPF